MVFNWKKTFIAIFDIVIAGYLLLAVSAFNTPAEKATVCTEVKIDINNESIGGFVNPSEIKNILEKDRLYPLAKNMADVNSRAINNGDNYYLDTHGAILPESKYATDMIIVTGNVSRKYAQKILPLIGNTLLNDKFWQNQVVQVNILNDGTVEMIPRIGEHIIYLGPPANIDKKLERMRKFYLYGLNVAGWNKYSYISVEFDNQIICKRK